MASCRCFSAPVLLPRRPPSNASTCYKGSPAPRRTISPSSTLHTPLHRHAAIIEPSCSAAPTPLNRQSTRPQAPVQRRAAPRPSRLPPRLPVRASTAVSPSAASTAVDSSSEPPTPRPLSRLKPVHHTAALPQRLFPTHLCCRLARIPHRCQRR
jgi:hypothetical protein